MRNLGSNLGLSAVQQAHGRIALCAVRVDSIVAVLPLRSLSLLTMAAAIVILEHCWRMARMPIRQARPAVLGGHRPAKQGPFLYQIVTRTDN